MNTTISTQAKSKVGDQTLPTVCILLAWLYIYNETLHPEHVGFTAYLQINKLCNEFNAFKYVTHIVCAAELFSVILQALLPGIRSDKMIDYW